MAPRITGWLHTECTRILNEDGEVVRLLSVDLAGMLAGSGPPKSAPHGACRASWHEPELSEMDNIRAWGFNSLRIQIAWANLEPIPPTTNAAGYLVHHWNWQYVDAIDRIVRESADRGLALILTMSQAYWSPAFKGITAYFADMCQGMGMPEWLYPDAAHMTVGDAEIEFFANKDGIQEGLVQAWKFMAKRYAKNPTVVALDMFNEPVTHRMFDISLLHLDDLYARLGVGIRQVNQHALLIFQDNNDDYAKGRFSLTHAPDLPDVVYCHHLYAYKWETLGRSVTNHYWTRAQEWGVPLWNGEFPAFSGAAPRIENKDWRRDLAIYFKFARENGMGFNIHKYSPHWLVELDGQPKPGLIEAIQTGF
jgi:aryl-phospho-beta-D-glucosidase BglC (GH1 family)